MIGLLNQLPEKYNVISSVEKVGFSEYYREMRRSKIFVSPSGWCEYTPKDYEAMYFRALLIKPCVEHIDTHPDILFPNETYVPVKWDLSDLNEKVQYYLENPVEWKRITDNAHEAFVGYFERKEFLGKVNEIISLMGLSDGEDPVLPAQLKVA